MWNWSPSLSAVPGIISFYLGCAHLLAALAGKRLGLRGAIAIPMCWFRKQTDGLGRRRWFKPIAPQAIVFGKGAGYPRWLWATQQICAIES